MARSPYAEAVGRLWPPEHPMYQPLHPPLSPFGLIAAIDTGWSIGYQRGYADAKASVLPEIVERRVTIVKRVDVERIKEFAEAMERQLEGKAPILVDYAKAQRVFFQSVLDLLKRD
jgi:hypothetical protein